jgi:hypothetical protein
MNRRQTLLGAVLIGAILAIALGGCAAKKEQVAMDTVRMLRTAGFELKIADTPEKMEMIKGLTQRRIVPYTHEGEMLYLYADAASCNCVYVGTPDNYQQYVEYQIAQGMAADTAKAQKANAFATTPYNSGVLHLWW